LCCEDEKGRQFYERTIRLDTGAAASDRWSALVDSLPKADATLEVSALEVSDSVISVRQPGYQLKVDRRTGQISLHSPDGATLVSAFGPHTGRNPTINDMEKNREREPKLWKGSLLREVTELKTGARRLADGIEVSVSGNYPRPGKPGESVRGDCKILISRGGVMEVRYNYAPINATDEMLEAGFALEVPSTQSEFRWLGQGPYAGYPGKDRHNEYGLFHLNQQDLYFPGNRREVELASLANPSGAGVLMGGSGMTVDMENKEEAIIFSHLALVPGESSSNEDGENVDISARINAATIKSIAGQFKLLPLGTNWPQPLMAWFGSPNARVKVTKPFLRSYDQ
jgi:beta-galactosidase